MYDRVDICRRLTDEMPELGVCGFDINVTHDDALNAWRVDYDAAGQRAMTFIDDDEVDLCLIGNKCLSMDIAAREQLVVGS